MSRTWTARTTRTGLEYGGSANSHYWVSSNNIYAYYTICLANCTCYAYGRILEVDGEAPIAPPSTEPIPGANHWHWYPNTAAGWKRITYNAANVSPGDVLCWVSGNHVAVAEAVSGGNIYVSQSYYTGDDGTVNSSRSSAVMGSTLQSVSNWMIANHPDRFFSYGLVTSANLGYPDYILKNPNGVNKFNFLTTKKNKRRRVIRYV